MKKYETPKIEVVEFQATDIIQTSGGAEPQSLYTAGVDLGATDSVNIFQ